MTGAAATHGNRLDADAVIGVGSPGMFATHSEELNTNGADNVYIAEAQNDMIHVANDAPRHPLGPDPATWEGAHQFKTDPGLKGDGIFTGDLSGPAHSSYFQPDSEGLYNMGKIIDQQKPDEK